MSDSDRIFNRPEKVFDEAVENCLNDFSNDPKQPYMMTVTKAALHAAAEEYAAEQVREALWRVTKADDENAAYVLRVLKLRNALRDELAAHPSKGENRP
jgi:Zn-dependent oligopeptidase